MGELKELKDQIDKLKVKLGIQEDKYREAVNELKSLDIKEENLDEEIEKAKQEIKKHKEKREELIENIEELISDIKDILRG